MKRELKRDDRLSLRLPPELRAAIDKERARMANKAGLAEVKISAAVRAILERTLKVTPSRASVGRTGRVDVRRLRRRQRAASAAVPA